MLGVCSLYSEHARSLLFILGVCSEPARSLLVILGACSESARYTRSMLGACSEPARSLLVMLGACSERARSLLVMLGVCSEFARSLLEAYSLSYLSSKNILDNIGYISVVATTLHVDDKQNVLWTLIKIETKFEIIWLKQNNKFIYVLLLSLWKS